MGSSFVRLSHCYDMLIIKFSYWIKGFAEVLNVIENCNYELIYNYENSVFIKTVFVNDFQYEVLFSCASNSTNQLSLVFFLRISL